MLVSPVLLATLRALELAQAMGPDVVVDQVIREVRMAEADVRAAFEAFHDASDDAGRLMALRRRNRSLSWLATLLTTLSESLNRSLPS